ncbi:general stress protein 26 [Mucilaginibacter yixingensis]|uniref:General stress protein 26 n=1 Tax=Mucilaginibacter yixingensis TaxID=1295612 RepID=A0A2T5JED6_9SPHI|nr:pyridoxamine 5'-phosphate oxidase family protein [Mucilaginibacter yixingensis]PTR00094.1 general stress protein 26 [Mucilaginibacter yixingensis]
MNSIDQQQPEVNRENLSGAEAVEKIKELAGKTQTCFFNTDLRSGRAAATRPMSVQQIDDEGNLWFLSAVDSHKNAEIQQYNRVQLLFMGSAHSDFLTLGGRASISTDKVKIKELWEPIVKTWFTEGVDDPRITVIKVTPDEGYYWDTKHGKMVAFLKMIAGSIIGKTLDDSVQGEVKP